MHTHLEQLGVRCLAQGSHLSRGHFLPEPRFEPTTSGYKVLYSGPILYPLGHDNYHCHNPIYYCLMSLIFKRQLISSLQDGAEGEPPHFLHKRTVFPVLTERWRAVCILVGWRMRSSCCISNRLKSPPSPDGKGFVSLILPCASRVVITVISIITRSWVCDASSPVEAEDWLV